MHRSPTTPHRSPRRGRPAGAPAYYRGVPAETWMRVYSRSRHLA